MVVELVNKCKCGARWRINYPFGKKNKGIKIYIIKHKKDCKYNKNG